MKVFAGNTADEAWQRAHCSVVAGSSAQVQPSRVGRTMELLHVVLEIADPRQRWILSRSPAMNPAFAIVETVCLLAGRNEATVLNYWNRQLPRFAGTGETYDGAYGYRLCKYFGRDQLRQATEALSRNPDSRQVVLQIWSTTMDLPNADGAPRSSDVPCNVCALLKVRNGRLHWTQIVRSNDIYRGLPYDIAQFTMVQEVVAEWLGLEVGQYHHWSDSLHAYVDELAQFSCSPADLAPNGDKLSFPFDDSDRLIEDLYQRVSRLAGSELDPKTLIRLGTATSLPEAVANLLRVVAAESARRRGYLEVVETCISECTNKQLVQAWWAWSHGLNKRRERRSATEPAQDAAHV